MERATLIEMIETGGCAGLDVAIMEALGLKYNGEVLDSLDAAIALVERVRPDWSVSLTFGPVEAFAHIYDRDRQHPHVKWFSANADTPAAALIAALLKAEAK